MEAVENALCGQDLNFVFATDVTGSVWFETRRDSTGSKAIHDEQRKSVSARMAEIVPPMGIEVPLDTIREARSVSSMGFSQLVDLNTACEDILLIWRNSSNKYSSPVNHLTWFRTALSNESIASCGDLVSMGLCSRYGAVGSQARWMCSTSCECSMPHSLSPVASSMGGCPSSCADDSHLKLLNCTDWTHEALLASTFWAGWADYAKEAMIAKGHRQNAALLRQRMLNVGCAFLENVPSFTTTDFCDGSTSLLLKPLAQICPSSCGCTTAFRHSCPVICAREQLLLVMKQSSNITR